MSRFLKWLFSPDMIARKRTIIVFLVALAGGLQAAGPLFLFMCNGAANVVCMVDVSVVASMIDQLATLLGTPEMGGVAFLTGLWAIISGYKKAKKTGRG